MYILYFLLMEPNAKSSFDLLDADGKSSTQTYSPDPNGGEVTGDFHPMGSFIRKNITLNKTNPNQ